MAVQRKILIIDPEPGKQADAYSALGQFGYEVTWAESTEEALQQLGREAWDLIITELQFGEDTSAEDGLKNLEELQEMAPRMGLLVVSWESDVRIAMEAVHLGADDFLPKPAATQDLIASINRIIKQRRLESDNAKLLNESMEYFQMLGLYKKSIQLVKQLDTETLFDQILDLMIKELDALGAGLWLGEAEPGQMPPNYSMRRVRGLVDPATQPVKVGSQEFYRLIFGETREGMAQFARSAAANEPDYQVLFIPLEVEEVPYGFIKVIERVSGHDFEHRDLKLAGAIGDYASVAISNALAIQRFEKEILQSHDTTAYNMVYFADLAEKEIGKSARYQRYLSVVYLEVNNYEELRGIFSEPALAAQMQDLLGIIREAMRDADIIGKAGDNEYYVMLPETDYFGSMIFVQRLKRALKGKTYLVEGETSRKMDLLFSPATFPQHGKSFQELRHRTLRHTREIEESLYRRMGMDDKGFFEMIEALLGDDGEYEPVETYLQRWAASKEEPPLLVEGKISRVEDEEGLNRHLVLSKEQAVELVELMADEVNRHPQRRGLMFVGSPLVHASVPLLAPFQGVQKNRTMIYMLGQVEGETSGFSDEEITVVSPNGVDLAPYRFAFYLNDLFGYGLILREREDGHFVGMHSADTLLIENLVGKLQSRFLFQSTI